MERYELETFMDLVFRFGPVLEEQLARLRNMPLGWAKRFVRDGCRSGLLGVARVVTSRPLPLAEPVYGWCPADRTSPPFDSCAYRLQSRRRGHPQETEVVFAVERCARLLGGVASKLSHPFEFAHDLELPEVFIAARTILPELSEGWVSGGFFKLQRRTIRGYLPDIVVLHPCGRLKRAVEFGGASYGAARLRKLHAACAQVGIPYEVW